MKNQFNLENQYQLFLERMSLKEANMHPQQKKQLKQTFFGACGQMLVLLRDEVAELSDNEAVEVLENLNTQVGQFFTNEINSQN